MQGTSTVTKSRNIIEEIAALGPWFHNIHLGNGIQTAPNNGYGDFPAFKWKQFMNEIPADLAGWTALDIGCNAGYYSFELARRGASVTGIDLDPHYLRQARWAARELDLEQRVHFEQMQVYDLAKLDRQFDLVIFMGVFYHLRYPMLALDIVTGKVGKMLVFQTMTRPGDEVYPTKPDMGMDDRAEMLNTGWPTMSFIEKKLAGDPTNWWAPNHSCILSMLNTCGMRVVSNPGHEIYIARPDDESVAVHKGWNRSEFLSATGRSWQEELVRKLGGHNNKPKDS